MYYLCTLCLYVSFNLAIVATVYLWKWYVLISVGCKGETPGGEAGRRTAAVGGGVKAGPMLDGGVGDGSGGGIALYG